MRISTFIVLLPFTFAYWKCPSNPVLPDNGGYNVFPNGTDSFYGPNAHCYIQINIPQGMYALLVITALPSVGDVLFAKNNYLNIPVTKTIPSMVAVGPAPFIITIDSTSISGGSLQVAWNLQKVKFPNRANIGITSGAQPTLLRTYDVGMSSKTLIPPPEQALSISTASFGRLGADGFMTGAMLYKGDKVENEYLECLYNRINETTPLKIVETVTLVFLGTPIDAGVFAISAWSDVAAFSKLQLQYSDNFGVDGSFPLDATGGMAGMMLYQQDDKYDTLTSYVLSPTTANLSLYAGGVPISISNLISVYGSVPNADDAMPQAIAGPLKTFVMPSNSVRIQVLPNTNGSMTARENMTGFFMSTNYPFVSATQSGSQYFQSDFPVNLIVMMDTIDSSTTITVFTTGIHEPQTCIFTSTSVASCKIYGTNFLFTSQSSSQSTAGGIVRYRFGDHKGTEKGGSSNPMEIPILLLLASTLLLSK